MMGWKDWLPCRSLYSLERSSKVRRGFWLSLSSIFSPDNGYGLLDVLKSISPLSRQVTQTTEDFWPG